MVAPPKQGYRELGEYYGQREGTPTWDTYQVKNVCTPAYCVVWKGEGRSIERGSGTALNHLDFVS